MPLVSLTLAHAAGEPEANNACVVTPQQQEKEKEKEKEKETKPPLQSGSKACVQQHAGLATHRHMTRNKWARAHACFAAGASTASTSDLHSDPKYRIFDSQALQVTRTHWHTHTCTNTLTQIHTP